MSYDFNTRPTPCDHYQLIERYVVSATDLRTLLFQANPSQRMRAPINGQQTVKLYIGGVLVSPSHPVYGYQILPDELTVKPKLSKIVFNNPVRVTQPGSTGVPTGLMVEVSYITQQSYCIRCSGLGKVTDVQKSNMGSFQHINGVALLAQRCLKFMLTSVCPFYPQFTSQIKSYIGQKFGLGITAGDITNQTTTALQNLKNIQAAQQTVQPLDPSEILKDIVSVTAIQSPQDPTVVNVNAQVTNYGSTQAQPLNFSIRTR